MENSILRMSFLWFEFDCKNQCKNLLSENLSITLLHMLRMYMKIKILRAVQKIDRKNSRLGKKVRKEFHRKIVTFHIFSEHLKYNNVIIVIIVIIIIIIHVIIIIIIIIIILNIYNLLL